MWIHASLLLAAMMMHEGFQGPAPDAVARSAGRVVATVDDVPITGDRLDAATNAAVPLESFHRTVSAERLRRVRQDALRRLIDEQLVIAEGVRSGIVVRQKEIDAALDLTIRQYPTRPAFDEARARAHQSMDDLRTEIRNGILMQKTWQRDVGSHCQVSLLQARHWFDEHPERFLVPEALHIEAITISVELGAPAETWADARQRILEAVAAVKAGESFAAVARRVSTDASRQQSGDMGLVHRGSLSDAFEAATRGLRAGDLTDVIQTIYGFHVIRIADIRAPVQSRFTDVSRKLRADLTTERCEAMREAWLETLRDRAVVVVHDADLPLATPDPL